LFQKKCAIALASLLLVNQIPLYASAEKLLSTAGTEDDIIIEIQDGEIGENILDSFDAVNENQLDSCYSNAEASMDCGDTEVEETTEAVEEITEYIHNLDIVSSDIKNIIDGKSKLKEDTSVELLHYIDSDGNIFEYTYAQIKSNKITGKFTVDDDRSDEFIYIGSITLAKSTTTLTIPNEIAGTTVKAIGYDVMNTMSSGVFNTQLVTVRIPDTIDYMYPFAFANCKTLKHVNTYDGIKDALEDTIYVLGQGAFYGCENLVTIKFIDNGNYPYNTSYAFYRCSSLISCEIINNTTLQGLGTSTFEDCYSLKNVSLIDNTKEDCSFGGYIIHKDSFKNCVNLVSVTLPETTFIIENSAFYNCHSLININLLNIDTIGNNTFYGCYSLTDVNLPDIVSIGENAFINCSGLKTITIGENIQYIPACCFSYCTNIESITFPDKFYSGSEIEYDTVTYLDPNGYERSYTPSQAMIGPYAFYKCTNLKSINLPSNTEFIDNDAFYECETIE